MTTLKFISHFMDTLLPLYFLIAACAIEIPAWWKKRKRKGKQLVLLTNNVSA